MTIKGFKAFYRDMTNNYGMKYEEGKTYYAANEAKFGLKGNGFHFCKNIEDTFRFIDDAEPKIARVTATGDIEEGFDDYNGYYDMYAATTITINHILTREEVVDELCKRPVHGTIRTIECGYHFTKEELEIIRKHFRQNVSLEKYIDYYINGNKEAFNIRKIKSKVLKKY